MKVMVCDICGREFGTYETRYKIKKKVWHKGYEGECWCSNDKLDICGKCMDAVRFLSTNDEVEDFVSSLLIRKENE